MRNCRWHECNKLFDGPERSGFCCPECQIKRGTWKATRGAPLVDLLIDGYFGELTAIGYKLREEIKRATAATD